MVQAACTKQHFMNLSWNSCSFLFIWFGCDDDEDSGYRKYQSAELIWYEYTISCTAYRMSLEWKRSNWDEPGEMNSAKKYEPAPIKKFAKARINMVFKQWLYSTGRSISIYLASNNSQPTFSIEIIEHAKDNFGTDASMGKSLYKANDVVRVLFPSSIVWIFKKKRNQSKNGIKTDQKKFQWI